MTSVQLREISAAYGRNRVLDRITLEIAAGEFIALLGPSGCGKTTLLKIIAGLMQPSSGDVRFNDESILGVAAERRRLAMVFQKPLLFPYLNVEENVAFGLKMKGFPGEERVRRVREALALVQMEDFGGRSPRQLSGGQEQRIALARALVTEPRVLLLDEPFSALDEKLRAEMRSLVRSLQQRLGITTIFVTHDQDEAAALADRIALLLDGGLEQFSPPRDFYLEPRTEAAARFFGWKVRPFELFEHTSIPDRQPAAIAFRPERAGIKKIDEQISGDAINFEATVVRVTDLGTILRCGVTAIDGESFEIDLPAGTPNDGLNPGTRVMIEISHNDLRFF